MYQFLRYMKLLLVIVLICQPLNSIAADADFTCNIQVLSETSEVVISGNVPNIYAGLKVTLEVINTNRDIAELDENNPLSMIEVFNYIEDTTAGLNGEFNFRYTNLGETGVYNVNIGVSGKDTAYTTSFNYYNSQSEQTIINDINAAKASADTSIFKSAFITNYSRLNLNCLLYNNLLAAGKNLDEFYKLMAESPLVNSVDELQEQADEMIIVNQINIAQDTTTINNLFEGVEENKIVNYKNELGIGSSTVYNTYLTGSVGEYVRTELVAKAFRSKEEISTTFKNQTIRYAILKASGWENVKTALMNNKDLLQLTTTRLDKLDSPSEVYRLLEGRDYDTLAKVKSAFDSAITDRINAESNSGKGSGGGGGSSSGETYSIKVFPEQTQTEQPSSIIFDDLGDVDWARESIEALYRKGIIKGKSDKFFVPNDSITREEFVKLLVLGIGVYNEQAEVSFRDVSSNEWYYSYIASAVKAGIITGKEADLFGVGEVITREDMATIAYRAIIYSRSDLRDEKAQNSFSDSKDISAYATEGVSFMQNKKIILGTGEGQFLPKEHSTRGQAAVIVYRLIGFLSK